jgi:TPR repeat protein
MLPAAALPAAALEAPRPQPNVSAALPIPIPPESIPSVPPKSPPPSGLPAFKSEIDAFRSGIRDYNAGDKSAAVQALEYAATKGHPLAQWKLGRMYAHGDGVDHDDLKAFEYFSKVADEHADDGPGSTSAPFVSSAFVALGAYYLEGIPKTYVKADPERAREMFSYAATYYGDPDAQYNLARMLLDGQGAQRDPRQAARWLHLAAEKGHVASEALLGHLLITGQGVPRSVARGLMWLTLARDSADPTRDAWIIDLHAKASASASDEDRQAALAFLQQHMRR